MDMRNEQTVNPWDRSLRGVNSFIEGIARRIPLIRSLRNAFTGESEDLINWEQAGEIAVMVAQSEAEVWAPVESAIQDDFETMMERSEKLVREYSQLEPREPIGPLLVFDRPDWIRTNLNSFKLIFQPLAESYQKTLERLEEQRKKPLRLGRKLTHGLLTAQLGMVIGYLARNVLGQFDLGLPRMEDSGKLYIVYPNLLKAERKMLRQFLGVTSYRLGCDEDILALSGNRLADTLLAVGVTVSCVYEVYSQFEGSSYDGDCLVLFKPLKGYPADSQSGYHHTGLSQFHLVHANSIILVL